MRHLLSTINGVSASLSTRCRTRSGFRHGLGRAGDDAKRHRERKGCFRRLPKGFELEDRASDHERCNVLADYFGFFKKDYTQAIPVYEESIRNVRETT